MKQVFLASAIAATALVASVATVSAAPYPHAPYRYVAAHAYPTLLAFPRGVSYGIGYHGAGTITGGPSGGLPSRN